MTKEELVGLLNAKYSEIIACWEVPPSGVVDIQRAQQLLDELAETILGD